MKILHYLPGVPPVRGGGMIKYALDLIQQQSLKNNVVMLVPGRISKDREKRNYIKINRNGSYRKIPKYEIINALPVPMANGILDVNWYTMPVGKDSFKKFLEKEKPDVIHIHTFMGLHKEFLETAKECRIPVVFTSHDYFGICPKTDLMCGSQMCQWRGGACGQCSQSAFLEKRIILEHSRMYYLYRKCNFLIQILHSAGTKKIGEGIRSSVPEPVEINHNKSLPEEQQKYHKLLKYYEEMFGMVNSFHFNSTLARKTYENYLGKLSGKVIPISNSSISDHRIKREYGQKLRVGFVGGNSPYKGFKQLQKVMQNLWQEGVHNIELHTYGISNQNEAEFVVSHDAYASEEMQMVFNTMDILVVPSTWNETFGMVVLEALSYGVPVLVTASVGAADVVLQAEDKVGIVVQDEKECEIVLRKLAEEPEQLKEMNANIRKMDLPLNYEKHVMAMEEFYRDTMMRED